ncbi:MAG: DNA polymerase III subunit gamma/tau [Pyrinomonadaceae bacterium]
MSYQVIARKWRPQTFEEVTGQESITRTLKNAIEHDRLHHAYLFSGARGVGKTTTARLLAKALNCHKADKPIVTPCSFNDPTACASCREIAEGRSIDVLEIDAASNTGVGNVRETILENIEISPARDRFKVFIIDEVHQLSKQAFDALLKTLEEPPPRVVFIMATTELHKVPDTILSRSQQFEFRTIALNKILARLKIIADAEKINISANALREIARAGMGSMRDAQSAFDQVISFSGERIETADVTNALGIAETDLLNRVIAAIAGQSPADSLKVVDELVSRGQDLRNFCRDLLTHLRDLLVAKVAGDAEGLLDTAAQSAAELARQAADFSESDLTRFFHSLSETETKLKDAMQPRYVLEVGLVKLIEMRRVVSLEKVLERLTQLEAALVNSSNFPTNSSSGNAPNNPKNPLPVSSSATNVPNLSASVAQPHNVSNFQVSGRSNVQLEKTISNPVSNEPVETKPPIAKIEIKDGEDVRQSLQAEIEKRNLMWLSISLEKANFVKISGNKLLLEFAANNKQYQATWESPENAKILGEICQELFGHKLEIVAELTGQAQEKQVTAEEAAKQNEKDELWKLAEADPTVQIILKTFRGKIIEVWREESEKMENGKWETEGGQAV